MSTLVLDDAGRLADAIEVTREVRDAIRRARDDRKRYEPTWHSNLAFASGRFWDKWDPRSRQLTVPPEYSKKDLYSTDIITEYRTTALGELNADDDRPQLLLRRDDQPSEDYQEMLNRAVEWGWDYEWRGDEVLAEVRRMCLDYGTAAVRCRFDPTVGPVKQGDVPFFEGKPILDAEQAMNLMAAGPRDDVQMRSIRQGRIVWEPLSPFNILVPPGIPTDVDFPWECVVRPAPLQAVKAEYGQVAAALKEDNDISSLHGMSADGTTSGGGVGADGVQSPKLKGHVWLFTYYERASAKYPDGRTMVFAGNKMAPLRIEESLPYTSPDGTPISGIVYFHWWRVTGRFWSRSLVEAMKDPQRIVNKRRTQINEIIDRGLPFVMVERNSRAKERRGISVELVEIDREERTPQVVEGVKPGDWIQADVEAARVDAEHATGIRGPRLGENPVNVTTYAQLALLNENDQVKRQTILTEHKAAIARLVEASVYDMRRYWGQDRILTLAGDDDFAEAAEFNATKIPPFFIVRTAKGVIKPRSQAAEIKKVEDIFNAAINSQAVMADPPGWVQWLADSLEAGQPLDLPDLGSNSQVDKAQIENHQMREGFEPPVQYYDPAPLHIPIHREVQIEAELAGDVALWQLVENHIQAHVLQAQETAMHMAQMAPPPPAPLPGEQTNAPGGQGSQQAQGPGQQAGPTG